MGRTNPEIGTRLVPNLSQPHCRLDGAGGSLVGAVETVGIDIQRDCGRSVTEALADRNDVEPGRDQRRSMAVAERVEHDPRQIMPAHEQIPRAADPVGRPPLTIGSREYQILGAQPTEPDQ
jgi:hypothetical protein